MSSGPPLARDARVLVRLPSWVGDLVMAEPLVRALAAHLGSERLTLVARAPHQVLLAGRFQGARWLDADEARAHWSGHDAAFLCTGSFRSAWRAWCAGIPRRIGFAREGRRLLLTDALEPARERGGTPLGLGRPGHGRRYLPRPLERSLAELAAAVGVVTRDLRPRLEIQEPWRAAAHARRASFGLAPGEPFALACVGARPGSAKGFPAERWGVLLSGFARASSLPLVLALGPGEEASLVPLTRARLEAHVLQEPVADLAELAAHCADARLVLCTDSGPRHVARAVGASVLCLAGPTDPRHTAGEREREACLRALVPCGPCHREHCALPPAEHLRCWHELDLEPALASAQALLRLTCRS